MKDCIIVGHGLAGACVSFQMLQKKKKIVVIDPLPSENSSSRIAAGLYNPITGRDMQKTWMADALFPYLFGFYKQVEEFYNIKILNNIPIYIPFRDLKEKDTWLRKKIDPRYYELIDSSDQKFSSLTKFNHGGIKVFQSGYLDINTFLETNRKYILKKQAFIEDKFDYNSLIIQPEYIEYQGIRAKNIIFCDGNQCINNPLFDKSSYQLVRGELLITQTDTQLDVILNKGCFILPLSSTKKNKLQTIIIGATFDKKNLELKNTNEGINSLHDKVNKITDIKYFLDDRKASNYITKVGIRPATIDRRPIVGSHPDMKNVFILNGLGTKGVTLAPYFSNLLTDFVIDPSINNIPYEASIDRFKSKL